MSKFFPGDRVRIRDWDDMLEEYGFYDGEEAICTPAYLFVEGMKYLCGMEFTFKQMDENDPSIVVFEEEVPVENEFDNWKIVPEMLELVNDEEPFPEFDYPDSIMSFLTGGDKVD